MWTLDRLMSFDDVVGQPGIVKEMKKRSKTLDFPEVMFFVGPTGTGKTTCAGIVACLLNDKTRITLEDGSQVPNPESPVSLGWRNQTYSHNIFFYDGSKLDKAGIQGIEANIATQPMGDANKIIIIDEAQEIGRVAKGATLTLLEKRRKGVHLILCTMDDSAFDNSILSRGQVYQFRQPSTVDTAQYLFDMLVKKGLAESVPETFVTEGLFSLAEAAEGSYRDALQMLERCVTGELFTAEDLAREFRLLTFSKTLPVLTKLVRRDISVIDDLKKLKDSKTFFYASFKMLNDAFEFWLTGKAGAAWKEAGAKALTENIEELQGLLVEYNKLELVGYRDNSFNFLVLNRLAAKVVPPTITTVPPRPSAPQRPATSAPVRPGSAR